MYIMVKLNSVTLDVPCISTMCPHIKVHSHNTCIPMYNLCTVMFQICVWKYMKGKECSVEKCS